MTNLLLAPVRSVMQLCMRGCALESRHIEVLHKIVIGFPAKKRVKMPKRMFNLQRECYSVATMECPTSMC